MLLNVRHRPNRCVPSVYRVRRGNARCHRSLLLVATPTTAWLVRDAYSPEHNALDARRSDARVRALSLPLGRFRVTPFLESPTPPQPETAAEAMLGVQMIGAHKLAMEFLCRAGVASHRVSLEPISTGR